MIDWVPQLTDEVFLIVLLIGLGKVKGSGQGSLALRNTAGGEQDLA